MRASLVEAASLGMPIYGECGGLMYLGESLRNESSETFPMVGVAPARTTFEGNHLWAARCRSEG